jgi:hypothetical protein
MPTALADQLEQATPAVLIMPVSLEVLGQLIDASRQNGDLDFGRTGIPAVKMIFVYDGIFLSFRQRHVTRSFQFCLFGLAAILPQEL